jgi:integrase/recombinase XerD
VSPEVPPRLAELLREYLDHLLVERGLAENTLRSYRRDLGRYVEYLGGRGFGALSEVGEVAVAEFLAVLREGDEQHPPLAASSAARALVAARGLHRFAVRDGQLTGDVAHHVHPPTPPRRLPKALPLDRVERLLDACSPDHALGLRDRALLEFLYSTGARISEAVGLDLDDIDLADRSALLRGKGGKQRLVPIGRPSVAAIEAYRVRSRPGLATLGRGVAALFLNARGGRLSRQGAWQVLRSAAERAGVVEPVSPHTLRHSFATHLLEGGADVRVVQELLGHASVTTTQVYTLVTVDSLREVYSLAHPRARG